MMDKGDIIVDGHKTNSDHEEFKDPLPNYDKGGATTSNNNKGDRINHIYDNVINHILAYDNQVNVIKIKDKQEHAPVNVTTWAQKYVLKGSTSKAKTLPKTQYNLVDQLQKTPAQISILELLKISPTHKDILEQALVDTIVPNTWTSIDSKPW